MKTESGSILVSSQDRRPQRSPARPESDPGTCTVRISGGLGNQLFQYAAGRALSVRTGAALVLDTSFYTKRRHRSLELTEFPISGTVQSHRPTSRFMNFFGRLLGRSAAVSQQYTEKQFHYDPQFTQLKPPILLEGYFQSWRYFESCTDLIRRELMVPVPQDSQYLEMGALLRDRQAISLHVRRGDYVSSAKAREIYATCSMDYYRRAMEMIPGREPVIVFSDDPDWARDHLPKVRSLIFSPGGAAGSALGDLWLMTQAWHHIIANSTFSWWGAWLSDESRGLTIAPDQWFNDKSVRDTDLFPKHWKRI